MTVRFFSPMGVSYFSAISDRAGRRAGAVACFHRGVPSLWQTLSGELSRGPDHGVFRTPSDTPPPSAAPVGAGERWHRGSRCESRGDEPYRIIISSGTRFVNGRCYSMARGKNSILRGCRCESRTRRCRKPSTSSVCCGPSAASCFGRQTSTITSPPRS